MKIYFYMCIVLNSIWSIYFNGLNVNLSKKEFANSVFREYSYMRFHSISNIRALRLRSAFSILYIFLPLKCIFTYKSNISNTSSLKLFFSFPLLLFFFF